MAVLAARAHQLDEAEALYRSLLDNPNNVFLRKNEYEVYGGLLSVLRQARKYEAVVEVCRQGLEGAQNTNRIMFHRDLALALMALGKTDEALKEADNAVEVADADNQLAMRRTRVHLLGEAGKHDDAIREALGILKDAKTSAEARDAHYTLSGAYTAAKQLPRAEEHLRQILKDKPDDVGARNDLGYLMADQGKNLDEAEKLVVEALELDRKERKAGAEVDADGDEDNAAYVDSLGWVYFRKGKLEAARRELERAAALSGGGDDPVVWDHLGDVYLRLGESAKARAAWDKALGLFDAGRRRAAEDRYKDIKVKLKALGPPGGRAQRP
jgi:tetratricopeptide (TPR) repeat protein